MKILFIPLLLMYMSACTNLQKKSAPKDSITYEELLAKEKKEEVEDLKAIILIATGVTLFICGLLSFAFGSVKYGLLFGIIPGLFGGIFWLVSFNNKSESLLLFLGCLMITSIASYFGPPKNDEGSDGGTPSSSDMSTFSM